MVVAVFTFSIAEAGSCSELVLKLTLASAVRLSLSLNATAPMNPLVGMTLIT